MTATTPSASASIGRLIDSLDLTTLIPQIYAPYRRALVDTLAMFLGRLPDARRREILRRQAELSRTAHAAERVVALVHACPTLHKLAQVVARHRALDPGFRAQLQRLESMEPRTPLVELERTLRAELGRGFRRLVTPASRAMAEASVATVLPFRYTAHGQAREGVFKILKPGIERRLDEELAIWPSIGEALDEACGRYRLPPVNYRETFESVGELLGNEIRLEHEQRNLAEAGRACRETPGAAVPQLLPWCGRRVTAMTRLDGAKVTDVADLPAARRNALAELMVRALIGQPVWSLAPRALFHADPHAGNLIAMPDGSLGIIDWSLAGHLSETHREQIARIVLGGVTLDAGRIAGAIEALAVGGCDSSRLAVCVERALRDVRWGALPGVSWLLRLLDSVVQSAGARLCGDLLLLRKTLLTLEGVVADVSPDASVDAIMFAAGLERFARDWPGRLVCTPGSRRHAWPLSNVDLALAACSLPATAARFWAGLVADMMGRRAEQQRGNVMRDG